MKQLGLAVLMYVEDYDEMYFSQWSAHLRANPPHNFGYHLLNPYIKNAGIWVCPSDSERSCARDGGDFDFTDQWDQSYTFNSNVFMGASMAGLERPSETPLMFDGFHGNQVWGRPLWASVVAVRVRMRHNDGANVNYADGHAKWENGSTLLDPNYYMGEFR